MQAAAANIQSILANLFHHALHVTTLGGVTHHRRCPIQCAKQLITAFIYYLQFGFVLSVEDFFPNHLNIHGRPEALTSVFHLP